MVKSYKNPYQSPLRIPENKYINIYNTKIYKVTTLLAHTNLVEALSKYIKVLMSAYENIHSPWTVNRSNVPPAISPYSALTKKHLPYN